MRDIKFKKFRKGIIVLEAQSFIPEKFINLLWKNKVYVRKIRRKSITEIILEIDLKDYAIIEEICKRTETKIRIIERRGITFFFIKLKKRIALLSGIFLFIGILYYLSTFIWGIDIVSEHTLTPYEIRQQLNLYGIKSGINKKNVNVYNIEEKLMKDNDNIMWVRARIEGSRLKIQANERQSPPEIIEDDTPCNLIAKKDSEILRVYTKSGTSIVEKGDIVKKGQILVKGEQGNEEKTYLVHAEGNVIGRTFYEETKKVKTKGIKRERTGNTLENIYINIKGKKFYIKKNTNNFAKYDKIENNKGFLSKEIYYEVKEKPFKLDIKKVVDKTSEELYKKITSGFDKSIEIVDKVVDYKLNNDMCNIRLLVVAEEDIALPQKIE